MVVWPPILPSETAWLSLGIVWGLSWGLAFSTGLYLVRAGLRWLARRRSRS